MRVRMIATNSGVWIDGDGEGHDWPKAGAVIDLPDAVAAHEVEAGHAAETDDELGEPAAAVEAAGTIDERRHSTLGTVARPVADPDNDTHTTAAGDYQPESPVVTEEDDAEATPGPDATLSETSPAVTAEDSDRTPGRGRRKR